MSGQWIWESSQWPHFQLDIHKVLPSLERAVRAVAPLVKLSSEMSDERLAEFEQAVLFNEAVSTSSIEKAWLDRDSVRSSICRHLGLSVHKQGDRRYEAFTAAYFESIRTANYPLTSEDLKKWHSMLFIEQPVLRSVSLGEYRDEPMQIVSGHFGRKEVLHFQAPCDSRFCVEQQMHDFLDWLNNEKTAVSYITAAIAKFWFVTLHPFEDGNGRLSRIIAERILAKAEGTNVRLYAISTAIEQHKSAYYELLEQCQRDFQHLDLTPWVIWFLERVEEAAHSSMEMLDKIRLTTQFWDKYRYHAFNPRQRKLLVRLLETKDFEQGIPRRKYKNLVSTSDATAARDLAELVALGILRTEGEGRAVKYFLQTSRPLQ